MNSLLMQKCNKQLTQRRRTITRKRVKTNTIRFLVNMQNKSDQETIRKYLWQILVKLNHLKLNQFLLTKFHENHKIKFLILPSKCQREIARYAAFRASHV